MKVLKRSIPLDSLSLEHKGRRISIHTHRQKVKLMAWTEEAGGRSFYLTFEELYELIVKTAEGGLDAGEKRK